MKDITYDAYDIVFESLIDKGYSESEAEEIICQIIEDQREYDDFAKRIHLILEHNRTIH